MAESSSEHPLAKAITVSLMIELDKKCECEEHDHVKFKLENF